MIEMPSTIHTAPAGSLLGNLRRAADLYRHQQRVELLSYRENIYPTPTGQKGAPQ